MSTTADQNMFRVHGGGRLGMNGEYVGNRYDILSIYETGTTVNANNTKAIPNNVHVSSGGILQLENNVTVNNLTIG
jgi:hypothetical protein